MPTVFCLKIVAASLIRRLIAIAHLQLAKIETDNLLLVCVG
jgi:hypothetical protein